jgi:hypothetical protein
MQLVATAYIHLLNDNRTLLAGSVCEHLMYPEKRKLKAGFFLSPKSQRGTTWFSGKSVVPCLGARQLLSSSVIDGTIAARHRY